MNYNLIIADDESEMRQILKEMIPWDEWNLNLIGEAENGVQAIELIEQNNAHIILLDIFMPFVNGIEVCKYIYLHSMNTKIIILSVRSDFDYTKAAIKYEVDEYLLKPVNKESLKVAIDNCIVKLKKLEKDQKQNEIYYHYKRCKYIADVNSGVLTANELCVHYPEIADMEYSIYIGVFIIEQNTAMIQELSISLKSLRIVWEYWQESDNSYILQIFLHKEDIQLLVDVIQTFIIQVNYYIFISLGEIFSMDDDWKTYYKKIKYSLNHRFFNPNSYLYYQSNGGAEEQTISDIANFRQEILFYLNNKKIDSFTIYMNKIFDDIMIRRSIGFLNLALSEIFVTYSLYFPHFIKVPYYITEFINELLAEDYQLISIKDSVISYGLICMNQLDTTPSDLMLSKKIINYIHRNFHESDLSVTKIAGIFHLNPSYMGSLFKKVNNKSILQYISQVRMEHSKELLLLEQYKIGEIAEMVGYSDVFYYSKRFKKMYGMSPKDYTNRHKEKL